MVEYWDERYTSDKQPFEFYQYYSGLRDYILPLIGQDGKVLVVGCGNSALSEELYDDGCTDITSIDYSNVVIEQMKALHSQKSGLICT